MYAATGWTSLRGASLQALDIPGLDGLRAIRTRLHDGQLLATAVSPGRTLLATGAGDGSIRVWESATGQLVHELWFRGHQVVGLMFVSDARLGVLLDDGNLRIVAIDNEELLEIVRESLTRGYTEAECERFNFDVCPTLEEMRGD